MQEQKLRHSPARRALASSRAEPQAPGSQPWTESDHGHGPLLPPCGLFSFSCCLVVVVVLSYGANM